MPSTLLQLSGASIAPATWSNATLLIIDAQNEYTQGKLPLDGVGAALAELSRLLVRARSVGTPVVHIVQHSPPDRGLFCTGSHAAAIIESMQPSAGETVIAKSLPNAFAGTSLAAHLTALKNNLGRDRLIVVGFMTHMCVSATVRAALDLKIASTVVAAATATRELPDPLGGVVSASDVQRTALAELADRFAAVVPTFADLAD